jgi:hypothetical protein
MNYIEERLKNLREGTPSGGTVIRGGTRGYVPSGGQGVTYTSYAPMQGGTTTYLPATTTTYGANYPVTTTYQPSTTYQPTSTTYQQATSYQPTTSYHPAPTSSGDRLLTDGYALRDVHSRVHDQIDQKLRLETEKRELELLIQAEVDKQKLINQKFEDHKRKLKDEIYSLESKFADLESKHDSKSKLAKEMDERLNGMRNECRKLDQDNKNIQSELKRLAERTNQQIGEMQNKLRNNMATLEVDKEKFRKEADMKKLENANQIKKLEEDYTRRLTDLSNKVQTAQAERDRYNKEVGFLKDKLAALEKEAEIKLKEIEGRIRDEEKNKRSTALLSLQQKLKAAEEHRNNQEQITSKLQRELEDLERKAADILGPLDKEAKAIKEDIEDCKKGVEVSNNQANQLKSQISNIERECQLLAENRQKLKLDLARVEDNHASAVRDHTEKFNSSKRNFENEVSRLRRNIEDKERELKRQEDEYNNLNRDYQRLITNLQSNLNKTINSTMGDYRPK